MIAALEWIIAALGLTSYWMLARRNRIGWAVNAVSQLIWLHVAIATKQWPFVLLSGVYGYVSWRGWTGWSEQTDKT